MNSRMVDLLATVAARIEESAYHNGVILSNFLRSIRLDGYSCGAKSFYTILKYFGKRRTPLSVERELHTTVERTSIRDIKRVLKRHGLKDRREDP